MRNRRIAVIGLGFVGLQTALAFAKAGFNVIGVDVDADKVKAVNTPTNLPNFMATTDILSALADASIHIICVPTPYVQGSLNLSSFHTTCARIVASKRKNMILVIHSTIPPHTTTKLVQRMETSKYRCGKDFFVAYCPERTRPGDVGKEMDRLIGGYDQASTRLAQKLYRFIQPTRYLWETDATTAEVAKLVENSFRYVNIALANEVALACEHYGVDVTKVIQQANTHPRVSLLHPGSGVGGACLEKDTRMMADSSTNAMMLLASALLVNTQMPLHLVELTKHALSSVNKQLNKATVVVLGTSYKANVPVTSSSSAQQIIHHLLQCGAQVRSYDPYTIEGFGATPFDRFDKAVEGADVLLVTTAHNMFRSMYLNKVYSLMKEHPIIVDAPRVVDSDAAVAQGFRYVGVGYAPPMD